MLTRGAGNNEPYAYVWQPRRVMASVFELFPFSRCPNGRHAVQLNTDKILTSSGALGCSSTVMCYDSLAPVKDIVKALGACNLEEGDFNLYISTLAWGRVVFLWTTFWFRQHFRGERALTLTDFSLDRLHVPNPFWQFVQIKHTCFEN